MDILVAVLIYSMWGTGCFVLGWKLCMKNTVMLIEEKFPDICEECENKIERFCNDILNK